MLDTYQANECCTASFKGVYVLVLLPTFFLTSPPNPSLSLNRVLISTYFNHHHYKTPYNSIHLNHTQIQFQSISISISSSTFFIS
ncbi:hypothetical protein QVD17_17465 [Tagetes erecta]|uniref:Uncharacterized protein n=1 Tax=Tagetes erecta TaxID=13708 RepID=A0AAD8P1J2_TARER|nr:hypothetical protein QVD17_17465 [Tagetes erecta]